MALNEMKVQMLSIITHISVLEMIDTYMVTFLAGIQTCPLGPSPLGSNGPLGPSPLGSDGPLGPSPLGSNWILTEWQIAVLNYFDGTWVKESSANTKAISH